MDAGLLSPPSRAPVTTASSDDHQCVAGVWCGSGLWRRQEDFWERHAQRTAWLQM